MLQTYLLSHLKMMNQEIEKTETSKRQEIRRERMNAMIYDLFMKNVRRMRERGTDFSGAKSLGISAEENQSRLDDAIKYILSSKLPEEIREEAKKIKDKVDIIERNGGFHDSVKVALNGLLEHDLPDLVKDFEKVEPIVFGEARQEAKQTFIEAFEQIVKRFDELMNIHAQEAVNNIKTRANYIRSMHGKQDDSGLEPERSKA